MRTYAGGRSFRRRGIQVFVMDRMDAPVAARLGVTVTRKVGNSVVRSRLKRLARESFRMLLPQVRAGVTVVVNFHRSAVGMKCPDVSAGLRSALREAGVLAHDAGADH